MLESCQNHVKDKKNVFQIGHFTDTCRTSVIQVLVFDTCRTRDTPINEAVRASYIKNNSSGVFVHSQLLHCLSQNTDQI